MNIKLNFQLQNWKYTTPNENCQNTFPLCETDTEEDYDQELPLTWLYKCQGHIHIGPEKEILWA